MCGILTFNDIDLANTCCVPATFATIYAEILACEREVYSRSCDSRRNRARFFVSLEAVSLAVLNVSQFIISKFSSTGALCDEIPFFHPENPAAGDKFPLQETESAVPHKLLISDEIPRRVASACRGGKIYRRASYWGVWSVPEVHHALEQITTLILGYRSTSRLSPYVIGKVVP